MGEMSENFPGGKRFGNFPGENLREIFRGNIRECLGILINFLGKTDQREMSRDSLRNYPENLAGYVLREMHGGEFSGGGICLWKISKKMRGNFLGEIYQGNVWGLILYYF